MVSDMTGKTGFSAYLDAYRHRRVQQAEGQKDSYGLVSPYVSLRYFTATNSRLLFGRRKAIQGILERLGDSQVIFVVGGSGSGKSSIVRGGVLSKLRHATNQIGKSRGGWDAIDFRPATRPVDELKKALHTQIFEDRLENPDEAAQLAEESGVPAEMIWSRIDKELNHSQMPQVAQYEYATHYGLVSAHNWFDTLDRALRPPPRLGIANLAVLIDQFEEIFRSNVDPDQAEALFSMIRQVHASKPPGVFLIITMRAEDLHRCAQEPGLADIVNSSLYLVDWLDPSNLRDAIFQPARLILRRWRIPYRRDVPTAPFQKEVVDRILADVAHTQVHLDHKEDHLPLFQHALTWLWTWKLENCPPGQDSQEFEITEEDFDQALATLRKTGDWMKTALSRDVRAGLDAAIDRYADSANAAGRSDDLRKGIARAALRATLCAIASKDENGRFYREFVDPEDVVRQRLSHPIFGDNDTRKADALRAALNELVDRGFLVSDTVAERNQYDVTHEALIRNSDIRRWVNRESDIIGALANSVRQGTVSDEDLPKLKMLFDARYLKPEKIEAQRVYDHTFSPEWIHRAVQRRLNQDHSDEFAAPRGHEAPVANVDAQDQDTRWYDEGKRLCDTKIREVEALRRKEAIAKVRKKTQLVSLVLVGVVLLFASFLAGLYHLESRERDILEGLALAKSPGEHSQLVGANLYEFKKSYEALSSNLESDSENGFMVKNPPWYAFVYNAVRRAHDYDSLKGIVRLLGANPGRSDDEIFLALVSLNDRYRDTFGARYQVLPHTGQDDGTAMPGLLSGQKEDATCLAVDPAATQTQIAATDDRPWGLNMTWDDPPDSQGQGPKQAVFEFVNDRRQPFENVRPETIGLQFHPGQTGEICTDSKGRVLTVSRDKSPDGSRFYPTPMPEVSMVLPQAVSSGWGGSSQGLRFVRIEPGSRTGEVDARFQNIQNFHKGPRVKSFKFSDNGIYSFAFEPARFTTNSDGNARADQLVGIFIPGLAHPMPMPWPDTPIEMHDISVSENEIQTYILRLNTPGGKTGGLPISVRMTVSHCGQPVTLLSLAVSEEAGGDQNAGLRKYDAVGCSALDEQRHRYENDILPSLRFFQKKQVPIPDLPIKAAALHRPNGGDDDHIYLLAKTQDDEVFVLPVLNDLGAAIDVLKALQDAVKDAAHVSNAELTEVCYTMDDCKIQESVTDATQ